MVFSVIQGVWPKWYRGIFRIMNLRIAGDAILVEIHFLSGEFYHAKIKIGRYFFRVYLIGVNKYTNVCHVALSRPKRPYNHAADAKNKK